MVTAVPVYRVALVKESERIHDWQSVKDADSASRLLRSYFGDTDRECFVVLMLDTKNWPVGINTVAIGSLNACTVHPREVFKPAILANAASVIFCHNHPSGHPYPSVEDQALTRRLVEAGMIMGIDVLDHIILGDNCFSIRQEMPRIFAG